MKEQLTQIEVDIFNNIKNSVKGELKDIFVDYMLAAGFSGKDGAPTKFLRRVKGMVQLTQMEYV